MDRLGRLALQVLGAAALVGLIAWHIATAPETHPAGDAATTSIAVVRAARGEGTTGAYSRFGWNHPGPLLYQLLAPAYAMSGYREVSLKWAALILNAAWLTTMIVVLRRRAPVLAIALPLALAPMFFREERLLFSAWNPLVPLLPLALASVLAAAIAAGSLRAWPLFVFVLSFIAQAHVAFVPIAALLLLIAIAGRALARSMGAASHDARAFTPTVLASLLVAAVVWAVPAWQEWSGPGNLTAIASFFASAERAAPGWTTAVAIAANQFTGPFTSGWALTTVEASAKWSPLHLTLGAALLVGSLVVNVCAVKRRDWFAAALAASACVLALWSLVAIRAVVGPVSDYLVIWIAVVGAIAVAAVAGDVASSVRSARTWATTRFSSWLLTTIVIAAFALGAARLTGKHAADARSRFVETLSAELGRYATSRGVTRPRLGFSWTVWGEAIGVVLDFHKAGRPIAVPADRVYLVGAPFAPGDADAEFYLMSSEETELPEGTSRHEWIATMPPFRLIRVYR